MAIHGHIWDSRRERKERPSLHHICGFHAATNQQSSVILVAGVSIAVASWAGKAGIEAYEAYKKNAADSKTEAPNNESSDTANEQKEGEGGGVSEWFSFFSSKVGYYEGGFEDEMTKKEAAQILGVREHHDAKRIRAAHRRLLVLNHPDTGGSTFLATKINQAKEKLLGGQDAD
jgi:hypothetical protein